MSDVSIIVYGGGEVFQQIFEAVARITGGDSYDRLIRLALLFGGVWTVIQSSVSRDLTRNIKYLGMYGVVYSMLFVPTMTVQIIDRTQHDKPFAVDNIPAGLAVTAHLSSLLGDGLTRMMEQNFSLPDDLQYNHSGLVMASKLVTSANRLQIRDERFAQNLQHFMNQCVFYDLYQDKYSLQRLLHADNPWNFLKQHASPARAFEYDGDIVTCREGAGRLDQQWQQAIQQAGLSYGQRLFPGGSNQQNPQQSLMQYLPTSYTYLAKVSTQGRQMLQQAMLKNSLQNSLQQQNLTRNNEAAAYAFAKAQQHKRQTNQTMGQMAAHWLPIMKVVFEALLYGAFPIVFLLTLLPIGVTVFKNYLYSLLWLQTWAPLYAILNLVVSFYAQQQSQHVLGQDSTVTMAAQTQLAQINDDMAGLAGYLSLSIPFLASGLVKGMATTMTRLAQYIGGVTQSAAVGAAGDATTGNISMGNLQMANQNAFNTTGFHWNTNAEVMSGHSSYQLPGGSTMTHTASGETVMNTHGALSQLGTNINLAQSVHHSATQQAEQAESAAQDKALSASDSLSTAFRQLDELGQNQSHMEASGDHDSMSQSNSLNQSAHELNKYVDQFAHDHNLTHAQATTLLGKISAGVGLGSGQNHIGMSGEVSSQHRNEAQQLFNEAENFVKEHQLDKVWDTARRGAHEAEHRAQDEQTARQMHQLSNSLDEAHSQQEEAKSLFHRAHSYRETAQHYQDNATSINAQAEQQFFNWLQESGEQHSAITPQQFEQMVQHDPQQAKQLAEQFVEAKTAEHLQDGLGDDTVGANGVQEAHQQYNQNMQEQSDIQNQYQAQQNQMQDRGQRMDTGHVSDRVSDEVSQFETRAKGELKEERLNQQQAHFQYERDVIHQQKEDKARPDEDD